MSNVVGATLFGVAGGAKGGLPGAVVGGVLAGSAAAINELHSSAKCMQRVIDDEKVKDQPAPSTPAPQQNVSAAQFVMGSFSGF